MDTLGLGRLLTDEADHQRDAIHIAVAPVTAFTPLCPGDHIRFAADDNTDLVVRVEPIKGHKGIGIVDPFLDPYKVIPEGARFWMFLYPGTITSLRHDWTHPAFAAARLPPMNDVQAASVAWITNWADQYDVTYAEMIRRATEWVRDDRYFSKGGMFEGERVPDEFWIHFERATGIPVDPEDRGSFFTCSC